MQKRYQVTITYENNRRNSLVVWAANEDAAKKLALKWWGSTMYKSIDCELFNERSRT